MSYAMRNVIRRCSRRRLKRSNSDTIISYTSSTYSSYTLKRQRCHARTIDTWSSAEVLLCSLRRARFHSQTYERYFHAANNTQHIRMPCNTGVYVPSVFRSCRVCRDFFVTPTNWSADIAGVLVCRSFVIHAQIRVLFGTRAAKAISRSFK